MCFNRKNGKFLIRYISFLPRKHVWTVGIFYVFIGFMLGFAICFFYWKSDPYADFKRQIDQRKNFIPQYYQLNIPGGGLWCSPVKARLSGAAVFLVHKSSRDNIKRLLVVVEKKYKNGKVIYNAGVPAGFYDPEYGSKNIAPEVVVAAERDIYESNLKQAPISVSEAYAKVLKDFATNKDRVPTSYVPDKNLMETAFRETFEETGFDLRKYYQKNLLKHWKLIDITETKDTVAAFYYGEIHSVDLPVLHPQEADIKIAAWVPWVISLC